MATIEVLGECDGGGHLRVRVTMSGGQVITEEVDIADLRNRAPFSARDVLYEGVRNALADARPRTLAQVRQALEGKVFPERISAS